jgi:hypothetical protein
MVAIVGNVSCFLLSEARVSGLEINASKSNETSIEVEHKKQIEDKFVLVLN